MTGRLTYETFPRVTLRRLQGNFYVNQVQVLLGHGTFGDYQARFFFIDLVCGISESTISHCLYVFALWNPIKDKFFPRDYQTRLRRDLCLDGYCPKGLKVIVNDLRNDLSLDRNLGRRRTGRFPEPTVSPTSLKLNRTGPLLPRCRWE